MAKNFSELTPTFGLAYKKGVQPFSERTVISVANGGFFPKCLVISLFLLLTLPLLPFSAKGQTQISVPARGIQKLIAASPDPLSQDYIPWTWRMWGSRFLPLATITPSGVKVEAYDSYHIFSDTMQLVVYSTRTGRVVYQTFMETDGRSLENYTRVVAECPKQFFGNEDTYLFSLCEIYCGVPYQISGATMCISVDYEVSDPFWNEEDTCSPYKDTRLEVLPFDEGFNVIFKVKKQPGSEKFLYVFTYDVLSSRFQYYPLDFEGVENGFAVYSYAQEAVPGILYPIDGQVFRVYIRDKKSPEIPAELLSGFRLVLGRVFHEDFSDIKTDLEERLLALTASTSVFAADYVRVSEKDGKNTYFALSDKPEVTFEGNFLVLKTERE
ncbi:MAG: hypothetical protein ACFNWZ_01415, partial [Candidatus Absconditicoccaceae bacterium]